MRVKWIPVPTNMGEGNRVEQKEQQKSPQRWNSHKGYKNDKATGHIIK